MPSYTASIASLKTLFAVYYNTYVLKINPSTRKIKKKQEQAQRAPNFCFIPPPRFSCYLTPKHASFKRARGTKIRRIESRVRKMAFQISRD